MAQAFCGMRISTGATLRPYVVTVLGQWFQAKRGRILAVQMMCQQLTISTVLGVLWETMVNEQGWRGASQTASLVTLLLIVPCAVFIFHTPESVGLLPDGASPVHDAEVEESEGAALLSPESQDDEEEGAARPPPSPRSDKQLSFTRAQALRTVQLYVLMLNSLCSATIGGGVSQVFPALLRENGAEGVSIAMNVMIPNGITQAALPVIAGYMRDKGVPLRYLMAFAQAMYCIALSAGMGATGPGWASVYGATAGTVWGLGNSVSGVVYVDFFGREHLGSIQAFDSMMMLLGTAVGPLLQQLGHAWLGSYRAVWSVLRLAPLVVVVVVLVFVRKPRHPHEGRARGSVYETVQ